MFLDHSWSLEKLFWRAFENDLHVTNDDKKWFFFPEGMVWSINMLRPGDLSKRPLWSLQSVVVPLSNIPKQETPINDFSNDSKQIYFSFGLIEMMTSSSIILLEPSF